jgi:hypothetical protein
MNPRRTAWLALVTVMLGRPALGDGRIVEVTYPPSDRPGELVFGVTFRLWIPEGVSRLRAVIVHQHGCGKGACQGGETAADDLHWQALARKWDCALLGPSYGQEDGQNCRLWCDPRNGSRARFLQALDDLALQSGHPELARVPWCLWGHSGGGFWASLMQASDPGRVVAVWLRSGTAFAAWEKGEVPRPQISDAVYQVPVMCNPGARENGDARFAGAWTGTLAMFRAYRARGAPIGFAPDPRTSHECGDARYLAIPFFDACLAARLPEAGAPGAKLKAVNLDEGWLAPLQGERAEPGAEYRGDRKESVWLPNRDVAHAWMEYVKKGSVDDETPPPAPFALKTSGTAGGPIEVSWDARADLESGIRQFIVRRDGRELARLPEMPAGRFGRPLFQGLSYHDTPEKPLRMMRFVDTTAAPPGSKPEYQVVAINGAGLESAPSTPQAEMLDLTRAVVVAPADLSRAEKKAVAMLVEEVRRRTGVAWSVVPGLPVDGPAIAVGEDRALLASDPRLQQTLAPRPASNAPEGFRIATMSDKPMVLVAGNDPRGVLFGVGRLLRELRMTPGRVLLPADFQITTAPRVALRGHQLGYRPKTNSYDGWDLDQWERYIGELAVFGTNAIELIPPRSDDDDDSPHFPRPPMEMMVGMSRLADELGLDVWIWYPAMDRDYADPATVAFALREWGEVFRKLPRIDAVFVPGGDPGHTRPAVLMRLLQKQAESLRRYHPEATMWVSPQSFDRAWLDEFLALLRDQPAWLGGVVFGPQIRISLADLRAAVPAKYPIRGYPDITHSLQCQHPVPDWDLAYALAQGREVINPRPQGEAAIFRAYRDHTIGFLTYSEGCNDDVNKFVWSGLGWDPDAPVVDVLWQYARYLIGDRQADRFAQGILALERNWEGPLLINAGVETTLRQFQDLERTASPAELLNWRFQQALYRAYYDAYLRDRLIAETAQESDALGVLRRARQLGSGPALEQAGAILGQASRSAVSADRRARVFELAEALYQSIRMQLSVPRYKAIAVGRGANLDTIDVPLNNRVWLNDQIARLGKLDREEDRLRGIDALLGRTDPGPGGFYDDLGDPVRQPHLVRGPGFAADPDYRRQALTGFGRRPGWPLAWCQNAQSHYDAPVVLHYDALDRAARYRVRVVYAGDNFRTRVRLDAEGWEVHPPIAKPDPVEPVEFDVPVEATRDGALTLRFSPEPGQGGNGRTCQVAEVWLIRKDQ